MPQAAHQTRTQAIEAAGKNQLDELMRLVEAGGKYVEDACNDEHQTLLHCSAMHGAEDSLRWLLRRPRLKKAVDKKDRAGRTAMHLGAAMGFDGCVQLLVEAAAALDRQDETRSTPLTLAVRFDWLSTARLLLEAGADPLVEDQQGCNALDHAKKGSEIADLMSAFAGMRRPKGWAHLRKCILGPMFRNKGARQEAYIAGESQQPTPVAGHVVVRPDLVGSPTIRSPENGARLPINSQTEPARGYGEQVAPLSAGHAVGTSPKAHGDCLVFRFHAYFDNEVKRLEFEVAWKDQQPEVGTVRPGGEAERRGMVPGDRIVEIGGVSTMGKGREQLLPLLKGRPLLLKVDREERSRELSQKEPYKQIEIKLGLAGEPAGLDLQRLGQLLAVRSVSQNSAALAAGVIEGDAIVALDGNDVTRAAPEALFAAIEEQPRTLTIWRRPLGFDLKQPWVFEQAGVSGIL
eukprot:TRINITY_DN26775_c0_g1_i2.p1 TRINITY_DN26775_c0_g1~~TRINITY_DN26775_c0_g1_i2.p1  ORF type:complete len:461 (+),score=128.12 TRINITY_DN26775_c0_g1_i2:44-1426(+)